MSITGLKSPGRCVSVILTSIGSMAEHDHGGDSK